MRLLRLFINYSHFNISSRTPNTTCRHLKQSQEIIAVLLLPLLPLLALLPTSPIGILQLHRRRQRLPSLLPTKVQSLKPTHQVVHATS